MIERVGIIGVGHLASCLVEGMRRASPSLEIFLSAYLSDKAEELASEFGATTVTENQTVADETDLILATTRPGDIVAACDAVSFRANQTVVSTAVGVSVELLAPAVAPAGIVRAMPITCSAINLSPTLLYPDQPKARTLFELVGSVHALTDEEQFTPASVIAAYYGWIYALLDETIAWTVKAGVPAQTARELVLETTRGAAEMGLTHPEQQLSELLESLATPGGVTRDGLSCLRDRRSFQAWTEALDIVLERVSAGLKSNSN